MEYEYPPCREVKYYYNGKSSEAECGLVHFEAGLCVLKYLFRQRWRVEDLVLAPPMYTFAFYWDERPYNLYLWYQADGRFVGAYFNIVDQVRISLKTVEYRDLFLDVLVYPDGRKVLLDSHELPPDFPRSLRGYVDEAQRQVWDQAALLVSYCRMFLAVRGLETEFFGLKTEHLLLEPPRTEIVEEYAGYFLRNSDFLANYGPERESHFFTAEAQTSITEDELSDAGTVKLWLRLAAENRLIGYIKFSHILRGPFQSCFAGYALDAEYTSKGYMTEALNAAASYMFEAERLHRIEANIMPRNLASMRLVEKIGFRYEGHARDYLFINGKWRDHVHMVLLNEEASDTQPGRRRPGRTL